MIEKKGTPAKATIKSICNSAGNPGKRMTLATASNAIPVLDNREILIAWCI
jgi:hypothetical protein